MKDEIRTFEDQKIRTAWDEKEEEWYFSVVDVIAVLTGSRDPAAYWRKLKQRLLQEGNETVTNCHRLKLPAADGKMRLTDEWQDRGVQAGWEFAILTDEITRAWSGMTTRQYKRIKGLTKENLRDNMSTTELVLTMLGETSTRDISRAVKPETFAENQEVARRGGAVAGIARQALEAETGRPVISAQKAAELNRLAVDLIEGAARMADGKEAAKEAKEEKGEGAPDPADLPPRP